MNSDILTAAMEALACAGIPAEEAYPGKGHPAILQPRAAVHIHSTAPGQRKMVLEIDLLTPKADGGVTGEKLALTAGAALEAIGASCSQAGCGYDGLMRAYCTKILAEFSDGVGFAVYLGETQLQWAVGFASEMSRDAQTIYAIGENAPREVSPGPVAWQFTVTEQIPPEGEETALPEGETQVRVVRNGSTESYSGCVISKVARSYSAEGLARTVTGIAAAREEA